jgi:hypothetical protein
MILSNILNIDKKSDIIIDVQCDNCSLKCNIKYKNYLRNGNKDGLYVCKTCKTKNTNLLKYGVENPSQSKIIKEKKKNTLIKNYGVEHQSKSSIIKEKKKKTNLENWGVENPFQSNHIKEKIKETNLNNLGVNNPSKSSIIKEKKKKTNLENWGVEYPLQSSVLLEKVKITNLEKFGTEWVLSNELVKNKIKETNIKKYGVDNPTKSPIVKEKIIEKNKIKWGVDHYYQTDDFKQKSKNTLISKWNVESPLKSIIIKNKVEETNLKKWGNKEYINTNDFKIKSKYTLENIWKTDFIQKSNLFRNNRFKITKDSNYIEYLDNKISLFRCDKGLNHEFKISSDNYLQRIRNNTPLCTICNPIGDSSSIKENEVYNYIKEIYDGKIIKSYRDRLEIDVYIPELKIGFEFNGLYWHSEANKEYNYHLNKTNYFNDKGIKVIHIWEDDWDFKKDIIKSQIENWLGLSYNKIWARKCVVKKIEDNTIIKDFLNKNHIQGWVVSKLKLGLYYNEELVSMMIFDQYEGRKKMEDTSWNLSRFCNKLNHNVIGGASKLLKYFINNYNPSRIVSYADRTWTSGDMYYKLDFEMVDQTRPDYKYILENKRIHKSRFRKKKINLDLTEKEYMIQQGIYRIYDCGKVKFEKILVTST